MRIIAGSAGGIVIGAPRGDRTRPTSDRIRGAIFSFLSARVVGAQVLDLFAGSGGLGLEAASRGASRVVFVEQSLPAIQCLRLNIEKCRKNLPTNCQLEIRQADVFGQLTKMQIGQDRFDLVLADPPYGDLAQQTLDNPNLPVIMVANGWFVLESEKRYRLNLPVGWTLARTIDHGDTTVSVFRFDRSSV